MKTVVAAMAAALVLALTSCGGSDESAADPEPTETTSTSAIVAVAATLKDTCPQVEAAIDGLDFDSDPGDLAAAEQTVIGLSEAGDVETQNALKPVLTALRKSQTATQGETSLDAFDAWTQVGASMGERCGAVGSSAFQ